jgi:hypothetical protein
MTYQTDIEHLEDSVVHNCNGTKDSAVHDIANLVIPAECRGCNQCKADAKDASYSVRHPEVGRSGVKINAKDRGETKESKRYCH